MCLYPRYVKNPKYKVTKKNGGDIPTPSDKRVLYVPVGCGQCMECRRQKYLEWKVRLTEELKDSPNACFATLSFSPESLISLLKKYDLKQECSAVAGKAIRLFLERWRKKYKKSIKHWLITELGQNSSERLHLHGLIWFENDEQKASFQDIWKYGNAVIDKRPVGEKCIGYCAKYMLKPDEKHKDFRSQIFCSGGLGNGYLGRYNAIGNKYRGEETRETYRFDNGSEVNLPIYYRNKLYSEAEREQLWLYKINKGIRYVNKLKVDIKTSQGQRLFESLLLSAQRLSKSLGFGDDSKEWKKKEYCITYKMLLKKEKLLEYQKKVVSLRQQKTKQNEIHYLREQERNNESLRRNRKTPQ